MPWWFGPSIIGVIGAGILAGLIISYYVIRSKKRDSTFSPEPELPSIEWNQTESFNRATESVAGFTPVQTISQNTANPARITAPAQDRLDIYLKQRRNANMENNSMQSPKNEALQELEKNLVIATKPITEKLESFQTEIWNTRRSEFNALSRELLMELTESYVDMLLANNIVWLVNELGRDSKDLTASYIKLSNKIGERLQKVMPAIREVLK
jgi:hypothetical protein